VRDFFDYWLVGLLPFWQQLFELISQTVWPVAILIIFAKLRPLIAQMFTERGFSFEGFGAQLRVDARKNAQISDASQTKPLILGGNLQLPRTIAIDEEEKKLLSVLEKIPEENRTGTLVNALAIERLEKSFALIYLNIFGSQMRFLQKINEYGGTVSLAASEELFSEVRANFPELSDWDFKRYSDYLTKNGLLTVSDSVNLTAAGKDFIHFIVKYGLNTSKPL
jgi:hypothetical protein